ncbi:MAG: hypothetical protein ACRDGV_05730 [Candidatus Limnocylindria bacterium]
MSLTGKLLRDVERALHIAAGVILLAIVFTPLGDADIGQALRFVVAPMLVASGILMWQHARVARLMRGTGGAPRRARTEGR